MHLSSNARPTKAACGPVFALCAMMLAAGVRGQDAAPGVVSFSSLASAVRQKDYTVVQLRRFFDANGVVTVREEARVAANGSYEPDYELDYQGVVGEPTGSPSWLEWQQIYARHGNLFFEHGLFRIRDLSSVQQNYTLHSFGNTTRAGRSARRVVVFPSQLDKAIWLLEIDTATNVPLYSAEYDSQLRLLSEIEVQTFTLGSQLGPAAASATTVTVLPTFAAAKSFMGDPSGLVEPTGTTAEYSLDKVEVVTDPLNNRQTMMLTFTDGIDQLFITQTPGVSDAFAALPVRLKASESHTIARYRDPAMSVLFFWDDRVAFQVAGRGSLLRLDDFAQAVYVKAILNL